MTKKNFPLFLFDERKENLPGSFFELCAPTGLPLATLIIVHCKVKYVKLCLASLSHPKNQYLPTKRKQDRLHTKEDTIHRIQLRV